MFSFVVEAPYCSLITFVNWFSQLVDVLPWTTPTLFTSTLDGYKLLSSMDLLFSSYTKDLVRYTDQLF